jgi:PTH1 family peptidyl-tRNA hydrolase
LVKPLTFMNESGRSVSAVARYYKLPAAEVAAIYDDINIDVGLVKVSETGSAGGHNGVASLLEHLGPEFVRFRLGIGPKQPSSMDLKDFVLGKFTTDQSILIQQKLTHTIEGLELLLNRGASFAMNQLNRRDPSS